MAKKRHGHGRRPPQRRPVRRATVPEHDPGSPDAELLQTLRRALRSGRPLALLEVVSGLMTVTDPRSRDPFDREPQRPTLDDLVGSLAAAPYAETTAALTVVRTLVPDDLTRARIDRDLRSRTHPLPDWLAELPQARVEPDVWFLTHVLGDGDDYLVGLTLPSGEPLSALVYVDHNLGTVVKDAFVVEESLEDLALKVGTTLADPDQSLTRTDPATARAVVEDAIEHGAMVYPPIVSDDWPLCRPLVEWMVRALPPGGRLPERKEWSDAETAALAAEFFASPFGAPLDRPDERDLLDDVLWFGSGYTTGDPLRWSPVNVEILLADWFPRKVVGEPAYLAKLPDVVRGFIRYCHDRQGIRAALTDETLEAVDEWEPEYQRLIRSARPQGAAAIASTMFEGQALGDDIDYSAMMLAALDRKVGGRMQLQDLDDRPLPDEDFEWAGVPDDIRPRVQEVLDLCDRCADELLDVEHRTAMRRLLSRAAVAEPVMFRRKASAARTAATMAWVICRANDTAGLYRRMTVQDLLAWFGVKGSVSQRAEPVLRAIGVDQHGLFGSMDLGAPDLLTSERRAEIMELRDAWLTG